MTEPIDFSGWVCPAPLRDYPAIVMGHGAGGKLSAELIEHLFLPAFGGQRGPLTDAALLEISGARLAISTDSFVVRPLFFPGGNIGELAVNGTINDIAMMGAQPVALTASFILEEGMPLDQLGLIAESMGRAARQAGVTLIAGDTKVVDRGHGDGVFITTTGFGMAPAGVSIGPEQARPGDAIIVSGPIGLHGVAILSVREGIEFGAPVVSDTAALHGLVSAMLSSGARIHTLRDPTRGGVAAALNEIAADAKIGIEISERAVPVPPAVQAACELLGMDPLHIANEGKLIAFVDRADADRLLAVMRDHPLGREAALIGYATADHPGVVVARTGIGGMRVVDTLVGEQLPRIC
ncbi:hydrogenase expression/formation protein HypE [Chloroflexus sp.]|uniref:hydrogenase expression/formation protein HypE n=1 Tax=Chloroflexus sp. TaxID=1904827 RepID=UPI002630674C|nr:hydrogenase expression/formation protein HypE [uncultured Chloroflexus sp.]